MRPLPVSSVLAPTHVVLVARTALGECGANQTRDDVEVGKPAPNPSLPADTPPLAPTSRPTRWTVRERRRRLRPSKPHSRPAAQPDRYTGSISSGGGEGDRIWCHPRHRLHRRRLER